MSGSHSQAATAASRVVVALASMVACVAGPVVAQQHDITTPIESTYIAPREGAPVLSLEPPTEVTLTWEAPTTNTDGSPLTDLAGFIVYCIEADEWHWQPILEVRDPAATSATVPLGPGKWRCTVTAINEADVQSYYSNEGVATVEVP